MTSSLLENNMEIEETASEANGTEVNNIEDIPIREEVKEIISKSRNGKDPAADDMIKLRIPRVPKETQIIYGSGINFNTTAYFAPGPILIKRIDKLTSNYEDNGGLYTYLLANPLLLLYGVIGKRLI
ncbi:hypothetical protein Trydic_g15540 [Trypoxylus dichotomus]